MRGPYIAPGLCHEARHDAMLDADALRQQLEENSVVSHPWCVGICERGFKYARTGLSVCG